MMNLTHDEMNLLCIYQTNTRRETINAITYMQQYLEPDETELAEMSDSLLAKLEQMNDEEFDELEKFPDFNY
ncbi:MAG TPA: transposon-transfer assisting family protein [Candidatus Ornithomonoglobus merdipullorum]|uniref:Transposon-transfer assisting family protein n=1 Tax=Candidatus Ornithomonoglobus merdipullorum TaxID=2840895 RepID=A0A9D1MB25_9FIRM|nr:transposon-transfer assisting family protein [Candidatus Ornithomonoglobus merdipullorum]